MLKSSYQSAFDERGVELARRPGLARQQRLRASPSDAPIAIISLRRDRPPLHACRDDVSKLNEIVFVDGLGTFGLAVRNTFLTKDVDQFAAPEWLPSLNACR